MTAVLWQILFLNLLQLLMESRLVWQRQWRSCMLQGFDRVAQMVSARPETCS